MKYLVLLAGLICVLPVVGWLRTHPQHAPKIWTLLGFMPFGITIVPHLNIAVVSWPDWPGFVKGMELSALDILALIVFLTLPRSRGRFPFRLTFALFFLAALVSALHASVPFASAFYLWQLARMFFISLVVYRACADERFVPAVLTGMALGLGYEACTVIWQRFVSGELQTPGTFDHQNSLGMVTHFVVFPFVALLLTKESNWRSLLAPSAGLIIAVLTVSRATIGLGCLGYVLVFSLSALRQWTRRKARVAFVVLGLTLALSPLAYYSLENRFEMPEASGEYDERAAFEEAASMMISDHPLGIGPNNYVVVANSQGYLARAGVASTLGSRSAHVHNTYLLTTAETGYPGLLTFLLLLMRPLITAFFCGWRTKADSRGDLLLGLGVALLLVYLHCLYEWVFVAYYVQYMFAITGGLIAGVAQQLGYWRRGNAKEVGPSEAMRTGSP